MAEIDKENVKQAMVADSGGPQQQQQQGPVVSCAGCPKWEHLKCFTHIMVGICYAVPPSGLKVLSTSQGPLLMGDSSPTVTRGDDKCAMHPDFLGVH